MKRNLLRFVLLCVMGLFTLSAAAGGPLPNYLCFTANEAGSTVTLNKTGTPTAVTIEYSTNNCFSWSDYTFGTDITLANVGDKVYFRNAASDEVASIITNGRSYYNFKMSGSIAASGNVMSFIDNSCKATAIPGDGCFRRLFYNCKVLTTAPELPATTLSNSCYVQMFYNCINLTTAPELPATTLVYGCYTQMFYGCTSLNDIKVAIAAWDSSNSYNATQYWVESVASTGTFTCPNGLDETSEETYTAQVPSGWTVKNTYDVTGTAIGWTSLCVNLPLTVPTGAEVYYASDAEGSTITLTQIAAGTTMAPRTAVIVKADASTTLEFDVTSAEGTSYSNLFQGSSVAKAKTEDVYVLAGANAENGNPQFQEYSGTTLGAHKIWLPKSAVGGASGSIQFRFDDATAISNVEMERSDDVLYNMAGQRVSSDYCGIVIRNGKKMFNL